MPCDGKNFGIKVTRYYNFTLNTGLPKNHQCCLILKNTCRVLIFRVHLGDNLVSLPHLDKSNYFSLWKYITKYRVNDKKYLIEK